MTRPIYIISDLHLGDGGPRDNFALGEREAQLNLFLDYVARQEGELIVLGDLFEFWQMNISKIVMRHKQLLDRLAAMDALYVLGNHDGDFSDFVGVDFISHPLFRRMCTGPFERIIGGKRVRFMHGHEVDHINSGATPQWGHLFSILAGITEDRVGAPVFPNGDLVQDDLETIADKILAHWPGLLSWVAKRFGFGRLGIPSKHLTPGQNPDRATEMLLLYQKDKEANGYDVLIVGHTHRPGCMGGWYFNSGTWARRTDSFIEITPAGEPQVYNWVDDAPVLNRVVLKV